MTKNGESLSNTYDDGTVNADCICGTWVGYATYVGKRNVEGGPRQDHINVDAGRFVMGLKGELVLEIGNMISHILYGKTNSSSFYQMI